MSYLNNKPLSVTKRLTIILFTVWLSLLGNGCTTLGEKFSAMTDSSSTDSSSTESESTDSARSNKKSQSADEKSAEDLIHATAVGDSAINEFALLALNETHQLEAQQAQRDYDKALSYLKEGDNQRAMTMLKSVSARFPKLSGPWVNQAIIHLNFNQLSEAHAALQQALHLYPDNPYALNMMGIVQREQGQFKEAKKSYIKALKIDKRYAKAHLNLGILADLYLKDLDLALTHFEEYQTLQQAPDKRVDGWIKDIQRRIKADNS